MQCCIVRSPPATYAGNYTLKCTETGSGIALRNVRVHPSAIDTSEITLENGGQKDELKFFRGNSLHKPSFPDLLHAHAQRSSHAPMKGNRNDQ